MYINAKPNKKGGYSVPQSKPGKGMLFLPDELLNEYIEHSGFVKLTVEGNTVTSIKKNVAAHKAWQEGRATPAEPISELEKIRADVDYIAAMTGLSFKLNVFETAKKYYPRLWPAECIKALLDAKKITKSEYTEIIGNKGAKEP